MISWLLCQKASKCGTQAWKCRKQQALPTYSMKVEKVSSEQVDFLDLTLFKHETPGGWYELLFKPYTKKSSQKYI